MEYTAELTIFDERNGEIVGVKKFDIEDNSLTSDSVEALEDFVCQSISDYQGDVYGV